MQPQPAAFSPLADGFAFTNSWPSAPAVSVPTSLGSIGIGNAAAGLCGGMVFAALDYWLAGKPPPPDRPAPGTPLYQFIVQRLITSWHIPVGVAEFYLWMNLPEGDASVTILGHTFVAERGLSSRTIEQQWPAIKSSLDAGVPVPLGLVTVASASPGDLVHNHQVLACSYQAAGPQVTIGVYDPNSGQNDGVHIQFDTSNPSQATRFENNIDISWPVRGFFRIAYSPVTPP